MSSRDGDRADRKVDSAWLVNEIADIAQSVHPTGDRDRDAAAINAEIERRLGATVIEIAGLVRPVPVPFTVPDDLQRLVPVIPSIAPDRREVNRRIRGLSSARLPVRRSAASSLAAMFEWPEAAAALREAVTAEPDPLVLGDCLVGLSVARAIELPEALPIAGRILDSRASLESIYGDEAVLLGGFGLAVLGAQARDAAPGEAASSMALTFYQAVGASPIGTAMRRLLAETFALGEV